MAIDKNIVVNRRVDSIGSSTRCNKTKIKDLLSKGEKVSDISGSLGVSPQYVYKVIRKNKWKELTKKKKSKSEKKLSKWSEKTFPHIKAIAKKYQKKMSLSGVEVEFCDIESVLLDLMIHTDQKNIKNKDAYFRKYCPLKMSNLKTKTIERRTSPLINDYGEEIYTSSVSPESAAILYEEYTKKRNKSNILNRF